LANVVKKLYSEATKSLNLEKLFDCLSFGCDFEKISLASVKNQDISEGIFVCTSKFYIKVWLVELIQFTFLTTSFFFRT